jgi:NAD(P)-dependent dehydrogenase (short-subunit alcohol dehydrogenase family)
MRLENKTALITGGNSGLGLATAQFFISEGARVAITARNQETLHAAETQLGTRALAIQADVTDSGAIEHAVAVVADKFGKIDVLFANAGIGKVTPLGQTS